MEKREIDEEKKKSIQSFTMKIVIGMIVVIAIYLVYAFATDSLNIIIFEILLGAFIIIYTLLTDVYEPRQLGMFENMTIGQREGLTKIVVTDIVGVGALIYWILGMSSEDSNSILPVVIYFLAMQMKRKFRLEFEGTADDEETEEPEQIEGQTEEQKKDE